MDKTILSEKSILIAPLCTYDRAVVTMKIMLVNKAASMEGGESEC
ncbi:MAG TPA: hypothetical protein VEY51_01950 [Chondromyces sp.]|nr:hypothetical protein [Chondromyces sp.]